METQQVSTTERQVSFDRRLRDSAVGATGQERRRDVTASEMWLSLDEVRKAAETVAQELDARLTVLGVVKAGSRYVEILLDLEECDAEPCRLAVRVNRYAPVDGLRAVLQKSIEAHLRCH